MTVWQKTGVVALIIVGVGVVAYVSTPSQTVQSAATAGISSVLESALGGAAAAAIAV